MVLLLFFICMKPIHFFSVQVVLGTFFYLPCIKHYLLEIEETQCNPKDNDGPIPNAKIIVPIPMVPPKNQPTLITVTSYRTLTKAIGRPVAS